MSLAHGIVIHAETVAEAWEKAVIECWRRGREVDTEYGERAKEILGLLIHIRNPFSEPRIHRGDIYAAIPRSLQRYIEEVVNGSLDWAVKEGKIHYTYHERLFNYPPDGINQIDYIIRKLERSSFSRRAQAITWNPKLDMNVDSPPCLQRVWCSIRDGKLIMHTMWRSRDIFRAMNMNILAMTEMQRILAERLNVKVGSYLDFSNSAHIYEKSYSDVERFITVLSRRTERDKQTLNAQSRR